ncbi:MAG: glutathione peroxidase [bacterium]
MYRKIAFSFLTATLFLSSFNSPAVNGQELQSQVKNMNNYINDIVVLDIDKKEIPLSDYSGKVLLIVNVASECGNTPQYEALQKIYEKYRDKGFEILAFPCNDFGGQEPGSNEEIKSFCSTNYNVTFKLFDKIKVIGDDKAPLYSRLSNNDITFNGDVGWNFEKFLISREGKIAARFKSKTKPDSEEVIQTIEKALGE